MMQQQGPGGSMYMPQTMGPSAYPPMQSQSFAGPQVMSSQPMMNMQQAPMMSQQNMMNMQQAPMMSQGPAMAMQGQYLPNVSRPAMTNVANPPVIAGNQQYGPSYKMNYQKRS